MKKLFLSYLTEYVLYYLLAIFCLPLIYAATYQLPFSGIYTQRWFVLVIIGIPFPIVLSFFKAVRVSLKNHQEKTNLPHST